MEKRLLELAEYVLAGFAAFGKRHCYVVATISRFTPSSFTVIVTDGSHSVQVSIDVIAFAETPFFDRLKERVRSTLLRNWVEAFAEAHPKIDMDEQNDPDHMSYRYTLT